MPPLRRLLMLVALVAAVAAGPARAQMRYVLAGGAKFWITGSSNVSGFTCEAGDVSGAGGIPAARAASLEGLSRRQGLEAGLSVGARSFDCGNPKMNADLRKALKASAFPKISFVVDRVAVASGAERAGWTPLAVAGRLSIAGAEQSVTIHGEGRALADGGFRLRGSLPLRMTDFDIAPPVAMMGLVRARDEITAHFDVTAACAPAQHADAGECLASAQAR